jgi:hypothetical protein
VHTADQRKTTIEKRPKPAFWVVSALLLLRGDFPPHDGPNMTYDVQTTGPTDTALFRVAPPLATESKLDHVDDLGLGDTSLDAYN